MSQRALGHPHSHYPSRRKPRHDTTYHHLRPSVTLRPVVHVALATPFIIDYPKWGQKQSDDTSSSGSDSSRLMPRKRSGIWWLMEVKGSPAYRCFIQPNVPFLSFLISPHWKCQAGKQQNIVDSDDSAPPSQRIRCSDEERKTLSGGFRDGALCSSNAAAATVAATAPSSQAPSNEQAAW